jgi:signal peptidase I
MFVELVLRYVKMVAVFALAWAGLWAYNAYGCARIEGAEMEPAIARGSHKMIRPVTSIEEEFRHDDFVVYVAAVQGKPPRAFAGRVIGLPGDRIRMENGDVVRNGTRLASPYVPANQRTQDDYAEIIVPRESVFVLGDSRRTAAAFDSRALGPIGRWALLGRIP